MAAALHCLKTYQPFDKVGNYHSPTIKKSSNCLYNSLIIKTLILVLGKSFLQDSNFSRQYIQHDAPQATPNSEASTFAEVARRNTGTATRISSFYTFSLTDWSVSICVTLCTPHWHLRRIPHIWPMVAERDIAYDPEPIGRYNVAPGTKSSAAQ